MACGQEGKVVWPHRCLQYHKAAICCVNSYWSLLEFRSKKIAEFVESLDLSEPMRLWIKAGEIIVVASKVYYNFNLLERKQEPIKPNF
jgi:hypothetical protein